MTEKIKRVIELLNKFIHKPIMLQIESLYIGNCDGTEIIKTTYLQPAFSNNANVGYYLEAEGCKVLSIVIGNKNEVEYYNEYYESGKLIRLKIKTEKYPLIKFINHFEV